MIRALFQRAELPALAAAVLLGLGHDAAAQSRPTVNSYGVAGLIDMPSGEPQPDALLTFTSAYFGPISRTTLSFQITPRLSGSFRYIGVRDYDDVVASPFAIYYDRSFDLRYNLLREGRYLPSVTIGLQDFIGTGILAGEYIAATKNLTPRLKVTGGLGWGRLGSYGSLGAPFGPRPKVVVGSGGNFNAGQWFKGDVAPFAGVEWQLNDKWGFKAEYSSDAYPEESGLRRTFERASPFNFGVEYQASEVLRFGAYYMYGSEIGLTAHMLINPKSRVGGGVVDSAPPSVAPRPPRATSPNAWSQDWVLQPEANTILRDSLAALVEKDGIRIEALSTTAQVAQVRIRNLRYSANAQAVGRVARAMTRTMPASVEVFEIVPVVNGVPVSRVTLRRTNLEALEYAPEGAALIQETVGLSSTASPARALTFDPKAYPKFNWSVSPYLRTALFDPEEPLRADVGLRLKASYEPAPGFVFSGAVTKKLLGTLDNSSRVSNSVLPRVRTDGTQYDKHGDPGIERLTFAWFARPGENLYSRVTIGYLERMFGGVSGEVLWKPVESRLALGAEVNYVKQREFDMMFGFQPYDVLTGHVSAYYELGNGFHAQLDVGRYLAGDIGATLALDREFANGWRVGAFATKTNVSAADFGEGSFDKGIRVRIPLSVILAIPSKTKAEAVIRPVTRDGGARLDVEGRLYESVRGYHRSGLDAQWGRFWK